MAKARSESSAPAAGTNTRQADPVDAPPAQSHEAHKESFTALLRAASKPVRKTPQGKLR